MTDPAYYSEEGIMPKRIISREESDFLPEDVCVSCNLCELACSFYHEGVINPRRSRIQIHRAITDEAGNYWDYPVVCRQCEPAYCVEACPVECFEINETTGTYNVIPEDCIGCEFCVEACPWGEIFMDMHSKVALKCDLCGDAEPQCVKICPSGVLRLVEVSQEIGFRPTPPQGGQAY